MSLRGSDIKAPDVTYSFTPTSSGQHMIMRDQTKIKKAIRKTTIVINSRDRNLLKYPNSNRFRQDFRRPLKEIYSIELVNGSIPSYIYNINTPWNKFTFQEGLINYTITLTPGFYTSDTIASELEDQLNTISETRNLYTVTLDIKTQKLIIHAKAKCPLDTRAENLRNAAIYEDQILPPGEPRILEYLNNDGNIPYALLFYTSPFNDELHPYTTTVLSINNPARLLGFGINDYESNPKGYIKAPLPIDLNNFGNRIYLHLNGDNNQSLHRMEMGAGRKDCFHIFFYKPGESDYILLDKEIYTPLYESSPAPISRLSGIEVSFQDEFDRLIDFHHREVNLIFEITHLE